MLKIDQLSYWEKRSYFDDIDFLIIGAGIVGLSTAIYLRQRYSKAKIVILERGYLPTGASTKNAGFACFGSPSELKDDLRSMSENDLWEMVDLRYRGLHRLFSLIEKERLNYQACCSWDLIREGDDILDPEFIHYLNENTFKITGIKGVYSEDGDSIKHFGFEGFSTAYKNRLEGSLHTNLLIHELYKRTVHEGVNTLFGINVIDYEDNGSSILLHSSVGEIKAAKVCICTNGFAKQFLKNEEIEPARAQVLITKPISNLAINGTFHIDKGYTYFRNVNNRILLGGGRNLSFSEENTTEFQNTALIQDYLVNLLKKNILRNKNVEVDYSWSGIMGIGKDKKPIIKKLNNKVSCGVKLGGMGVAIGTEVGYILANIA